MPVEHGFENIGREKSASQNPAKIFSVYTESHLDPDLPRGD
jgi:hypothetical protein